MEAGVPHLQANQNQGLPAATKSQEQDLQLLLPLLLQHRPKFLEMPGLPSALLCSHGPMFLSFVNTIHFGYCQIVTHATASPIATF